jgi:hypothetical protein
MTLPPSWPTALKADASHTPTGDCDFQSPKLRTDVHERSGTKLVGILLGDGAFLYFCDLRCAGIWQKVEFDLTHVRYEIIKAKRVIRLDTCICCANCGLTVVSAKGFCVLHDDECEDRQWSRSVKPHMFCAGWEVDNGAAVIPWERWLRVEMADVEAGYTLDLYQMNREV